MTTISNLALGAALMLSLGACATPEPTIDTGPEAEVTYDGLHRIRNTQATLAWARPDTDLSGYSKIMLQGAGVQFRPGGEAGTSRAARRSGGPFEVTEAQKERFKEIMGEAFREELSRSNTLKITDEPGPDVLLVKGALLDVISWVPPNPTGNTNIQLVAVGEATLVIELRDSITETVYARVVDRRAAERTSGRMFTSTRVNNENELRRLARSWASLLRTRLEELLGPQ